MLKLEKNLTLNGRNTPPRHMSNKCTRSTENILFDNYAMREVRQESEITLQNMFKLYKCI